jgi:hypothetical protein
VVVDGTTGVFFERQTVDSLVEAIGRAEAIPFDQDTIRANAEQFSAGAFRQAMIGLFEKLGIDPSLYRPPTPDIDRQKSSWP